MLLLLVVIFKLCFGFQNFLGKYIFEMYLEIN